jgi:hypothetical protein
MSGILYPSGPQTLAIPTTILLPSAATPFNPSAVNPGTEACWDGVKALEEYGFFKTTFDAAQPPYPAGGSFVNSGTYELAGTIQFDTSGIPLTHTAVRTYERVANLLAYSDPTYWTPGHTETPAKGYHKSLVAAATAVSGIVFDFDIPSNCTVTQVRVRITPVVHGALPATMPKFDVFLLDVAAGTSTLITTATDASLLATYNVLHVFGVTFSQAFDASKNRIMVKFYGEADANSAIGLLVHLPTVEWERTQIGEELGELIP